MLRRVGLTQRRLPLPLARRPTERRSTVTETRADSLSVQNIHEMFKKYFPASRNTIVTLMPEAGAKK